MNDSKKIKKTLKEILSLAENRIYKEINNSFVRGMENNNNIESLLLNKSDDIYLKTMYEIVNSMEVFSKKEDIFLSQPANVKTFLENSYRKTIVKPHKEKYEGVYQLKDKNKHIHFEGEITIEATQEEIKAMKTVFLGGDTTVLINGVEENLSSETHMGHDRKVANYVEENMKQFLKEKWDIIVKDIEKGENDVK